MNKERYADMEGWTGIVVNIFLFALKQWAGIVSGSVAIIADGWHTLSDALTSIIVVIAAKAGRRPPDREHPFGHGRAETIAALVIGLLLALVGFGFIREAVLRFRTREQVFYGTLAIIVTAVSIVVKEMLAQFAFYAARKSGNSSVRADGWHHRSDAVSSVVVLTGIVFGRTLVWIDSLLALIVALMILHAAWKILREAVKTLLGEAPDDVLKGELNQAVHEILGENAELHHLHLHRYGKHREVSFHIRLPGTLSLAAGHNIASRIEEHIRSSYVIEATVHIEPETGAAENRRE